MLNGLVDMARSEESIKADCSPLVQQDKYPYGLRLHLDTADLEKLNANLSDWEIGDVFPLDILVKLVSKSANESEGGKANSSVSLQITHIGAEKKESGEAYTRHEETGPPLEKHGYLRYEG